MIFCTRCNKDFVSFNAYVGHECFQPGLIRKSPQKVMPAIEKPKEDGAPLKNSVGLADGSTPSGDITIRGSQSK